MSRSLRHTTDPAEALARTGEYLCSRPIEHNLHLTILHARVGEPVPGDYWWVDGDAGTIGYAFASPTGFYAGITPMDRESTELLVDAIAAVAPALPGVIGDVATAATFAATWAERLHVPARPAEGQRLYRLGTLDPPRDVPGVLRPAQQSDIQVLVRWTAAFATETQAGDGTDPEVEVDRRLRGGRLVVWDIGQPVAMAMTRPPAMGVARVAAVYTPPEHRRRGYASACVAALSAHVLATDADTCILYTQLGNPTSNAIYRAIGYEPVAEIIRYRFSAGA